MNDDVMGGRSNGVVDFEDGRLIFQGNINTNGGGFSSLRWPLPTVALKDADSLRIRLKPDGRGYQLNLRTSARMSGRSLAYRAGLNAPHAEDWIEAEVHFRDLVPTVFGQTVSSAPPFVKSDAQSLGLLLADGQDGPFRLEVDRIEICQAVSA